MKLSFNSVTLIAFLLLACGIPSVVSRQLQKPDAKVAMGYTIKRLKLVTSATVGVDGRDVGSYIEFVARNDVGYIRDAAMNTDGKTEEEFSIFSPVTKTRIQFHPAIKAKTTYYTREMPYATFYGRDCDEARRRPQNAVEQIADLGEGTFLGWRVLKSSAKGKDSEQETWIAPDCNCEVVYDRRVLRDADTQAFVAINEKIAISIELGNPDPSLFQEPEGYTEMSPSQVRIARYGGDINKVPERMRNVSAIQDRLYYESQRLKPKDKP